MILTQLGCHFRFRALCEYSSLGDVVLGWTQWGGDLWGPEISVAQYRGVGCDVPSQ